MGQVCLTEKKSQDVSGSVSDSSETSTRSKAFLRLLFVGPSGAGKSSIIHQLVFQRFSLATAQTRCAHSSIFKLPNEKYIQLIDTVGEMSDLERIPLSLIEKIDGIVYVYEQNDLKSLEKTIAFQDKIHHKFLKDRLRIKEFLIANKIDKISTGKQILNKNLYSQRFENSFGASALWEKELQKILYKMINLILIEREDIFNMIYDLSSTEEFLSLRFKSSFSDVFNI